MTFFLPPYRRLPASVYVQGMQRPPAETGMLRVHSGGQWIVTHSGLNASWANAAGKPLITFGGSELGREVAIKVAAELRDCYLVWPPTWGPPVVFTNGTEILTGIEILTHVWHLRSVLETKRVSCVIGSFGMTTWEVLAAGIPGFYWGWTKEHLAGYEPLVDHLTVTSMGHIDILGSRNILHDQLREIEQITREYWRLGTVDEDHNLLVAPHLVEARARLGFDGFGTLRIAKEILADLERNANV